jgi:hypothetical protein
MTDRDEPIIAHPYFEYSATLRIFGSELPLNDISLALGVDPTHQHCAGERARPERRPYREDAWQWTAPVPQERELSHHLRALWAMVEPHVTYLNTLQARVDVFCGYRSNSGMAGFSVDADALAIFPALGVPFGVSIIIDDWVADQLLMQ